MGGFTGKETRSAEDEESLIVAMLSLACGMHMHSLRRWARNGHDERGDFDHDGCGADEGAHWV